MEIREFGVERLEEVISLYRDEGWTAYLGDEEKLRCAFQQSLYVLGVFENRQLIGFIRCVGDGEHIVLVQDLLVDAPCRRKGIGRMLMNAVLEKYRTVRMLQVETDMHDEADCAFYGAMGFRPAADGDLILFFRPGQKE